MQGPTKGPLGGQVLRWAVAAPLGLLLVFLALPLVSLLVRVPPAALAARLADPAVVEALRLSLVTSGCSTAVVVLLGLPLAYRLATREFRGKRLIETLIDLPMVLPPTVAGVGLLLAFGGTGLLGGALEASGLRIASSTLAVVLAQVFVAAPFFVVTMTSGLNGIEPRLLDAAATLRASPAAVFFRVMLPLGFPSLIAGTAMSWARALGEFGATITFAGSVPGVTQTMPLAVYQALQTDLEASVALSVVLLAVSFVLLLGFRALPLGPASRRRDAARRRG